MSYVDVLIPSSIGLLMLAWPGGFTKPTGDAAVDGPRQRRFRLLGLALLAVAAGYLLLKLTSAR